MSLPSLASFRTVSKRPPIQEINNRLFSQNTAAVNTTSVSIALQQSYIEDRQSPTKASRSRSLATLGDTTNLIKYNTPTKERQLNLQSQSQMYSNEIIALANHINELARHTIQCDKDQQLDTMIEKEKLKKTVAQREHEIEDLHRRYRCLQEDFERAMHQKEDDIQGLIHEIRTLEQRLSQADGFMKRMNDEHNDEIIKVHAELQDKIVMVESFMKQLTTVTDELQQKNKMEQHLQHELNNFQEDTHALRRQTEDLTSQLEDVTQNLKDVHHNNDRMTQSLHFELDEQAHRCGALEQELDMVHQRQEETSQELSTWMNKFQHLDRGHQIHIEEMRKQFEFETQRRIDMENQKFHQKIQHDIAQFEQRIRQEQSRGSDQEQNVRLLESERDQLIEENRSKDLDIEDMKNEISTLSKIELDNRKMVAHIQYLENKLESIVQDSMRSRQYSEDYRNKVSLKERNLADQVNKLHQERDHFDTLLSQSNKEIAQLQSQGQEIISELHSTQSELQKTRVQNEEYQTNIKLLSEDVRNLQVYRQRCHELQQNIEKREDFRYIQLQESHNILKLEHGNLQQSLNVQTLDKSKIEFNRRNKSSRDIDQKTRHYIEDNQSTMQRS